MQGLLGDPKGIMVAGTRPNRPEAVLANNSAMVMVRFGRMGVRSSGSYRGNGKQDRSRGYAGLLLPQSGLGGDGSSQQCILQTRLWRAASIVRWRVMVDTMDFVRK